MRTGVTVLGIIFLVLGGIFFYMPVATATGVGGADGESSSFFGSLVIPEQFTIAMVVIGALLLLIGLLMPDPTPKVYVENHSEPPYRRDEVYEEGTRKTIRARH